MPVSTSSEYTLGLALVEGDAEGVACERCGAVSRVGRFSRERVGRASNERMRLCAVCLASALDKVTGYNVSAQLARWDTFSRNAVELAERSHRSARARRQTQEQRAGKRRRTEGQW